MCKGYVHVAQAVRPPHNDPAPCSKDDDRDQSRNFLLHLPVTVGMLAIRRTSGIVDPNEQDQRYRHICEIVDTISRESEGPPNPPESELNDAEYGIENQHEPAGSQDRTICVFGIHTIDSRDVIDRQQIRRCAAG